MMTPSPQSYYKEYRCTTCKKLLMKGVLVDSEVEIKCKHCGNLVTFTGTPENELVCLIPHCPRRIAISH